jgi:hypothetical protein
MPNRLLRWDDPNFVHNDMIGDPCAEDCVTLVDDYGSLSASSMTWPRRVWESLAEHILWERDRRKAEAAKQPKRWYVEAKWIEGVSDVQVKESSYQGDDWDRKVARGYDDGSVSFYIMAKDENEAYHKAKDAAHSLGVWNREYLA